MSNVCKNASRQLGILKRIVKKLCKLRKLNIYHSLILSNCNYCPLSWGFSEETNREKVGKNSRKSTELFIYNDYISDYDTLLSNSKMPTLKLRRLGIMALHAYKILNHQGSVYIYMIC